jgi:signal transduction histidine kinase
VVREGIEALQEEFVGEQDDLREFIADLRGRALPEEGVQAIKALALRLSTRWQVDCHVEQTPQDLYLSPKLRAHLSQLIRETVANAVRHGRATEVTISLSREGHQLLLSVSDNGMGVQSQPGRVGVVGLTRPWSLDERVHDHGGTLSLQSSAKGTRVDISIQMDEAP